MADLRARLEIEASRRIEIARAADSYGPTPWVLGTDQIIDDDGDTLLVAFADIVAHIAVWDPSVTITVCEGWLEVLERHQGPYYENTSDEAWERNGHCECGQRWTCIEILTVARQMGVSLP